MAETSLVRMNRIKAKSLVDEKKRGARQLARLVENPANFLNPILLLVLICQLVSATLVGIVAEHLFGGLGVLLGIVFEIVVIFVFFEAVPKNWAVQHADRAALLSAPIVSTLIRFPPIRWLSSLLIGLANRIIGAADDGEEGMPHSYITDSELKAMADVAHEEKVIEHDERTFIHSIIDFGDTVAREVMTPRPDMVTVEADATVRDALEAALGAGYSRIPVEEDGIDDIIGIAYAKDLVRAERVGKAGQPVRDSMRPAKFIPESKEVSDLLREMQEEKFHMAIVVDEYGGTAGLITLEDLLEELVGDIVDEFDVEEPTVERCDDGSVLVERALLGRRRRRAARRRAAARHVGHRRRAHARPGRSSSHRAFGHCRNADAPGRAPQPSSGLRPPSPGEKKKRQSPSLSLAARPSGAAPISPITSTLRLNPSLSTKPSISHDPPGRPCRWAGRRGERRLESQWLAFARGRGRLPGMACAQTNSAGARYVRTR